MPAAETTCHTPFGDFELRRYPSRREEPLRAWSAADSLLLKAARDTGIAGDEILVVNDEQGALATALAPRASWTDSAMAALALAANLGRNERPPIPVIWSTQPPEPVPLVLLRVPKQIPYFEYQLALLSRHLPAGALVLAAGMDKHLPRRSAALLEHYLGPTQRHPGQHKARMFSSHFDGKPRPLDTAQRGFYCEQLKGHVSAGPNVFSRDSLDIGSRFLLDYLSHLEPVDCMLDLACGSGVLGLAALQANLARQLSLCDESAMAIASARENAARLFPERAANIAFHQGDGLLDYRGPRPQLILCNPPFHINHAVDDFVGHRLLVQCARGLDTGGSLCLVANRHLDYAPTLKRHFHTVEKLAQNNKFILWGARLAQEPKTA